MKTLHANQRSLLVASLCKRLLIPSLLMPSFFFAAPGCVVGEVDEAANQPAETAPPTASILVYDPSRQGQVRAAMMASRAEFVTEGYNTVIVDVGSASPATLVPIIQRFLDDGKQVVLDSSGGPTDRLAIAELGAAVAGIALQESALSIVQTAPGAFAVTPIVSSSASLIAGESTSGNSPLAVLGRPYSAPTAAPADDWSVVGSTANALDFTTKVLYQGHGQPTPLAIPVLLDNQATYLQKTFVGLDKKRYLFRGDLQMCPANGTQVCEMSWGKQYSRSVSHGLNIGATFSQAWEKLTGGVTVGYNLTVTQMQTLQWLTGASLNPGWTGRPVSFIWRHTGTGDVKNAYNFLSRRTIETSCRPTLDCKTHHDTYVRLADKVVGVWFADVVLNQGSPTNSFNTFRGNADPNTYIFDQPTPGIQWADLQLVGYANKCLDVSRGSSANGTPVQIWDCAGVSNQRWTLRSNGDLVVFGGKCLDVRGPSSANGTPVQIWTCSGAANQKWSLDASGNLRGYGGKCLDVRGPSSANGTPVQIWDCVGAANQKWRTF
jgi:Ricin-type beta-trefoil lectin domain